MNPSSPSAILLISCPDQKGIVAAVTKFISGLNGNIIHLEQHVDFEENIFFMRVEWSLEGFGVARDEIAKAFEPLRREFAMARELHFSDRLTRVAVFVSKESHCLYDVLSRHQSGEWRAEIPLIVSNHPELKPVADRFGIDFKVFPATQEDRQLALLKDYKIDLVVLARYMQILSARFVAAYPHKVINIHHSFLPSFPGARPYHSAYARGVKIIGATSHYATEDLDNGPIIEQDIIRVSHKDAVDDMIRKGRDLERVVLARAIHAHLENRILVHKNKTVIFE